MIDAAVYIRDLLLAHEPLTAIVGNRIYPQWVKEHVETPYLTYIRITAPRTASKDGTASIEARYQLDIFADSYADIESIYQMVADIGGLLDEHLTSNIHIYIVDDGDSDTDKEFGKFRRTVDFIVRLN